jgi:hypothetical protein
MAVACHNIHMNMLRTFASELGTMKTKTLLFLASLTVAVSLTSCDQLAGPYTSSYGSGYGSSYASGPNYYGGGYNSRPVVSYNSFNSYNSRPYSYSGHSNRSYPSTSFASSMRGFGFNGGSSGAPAHHSSGGYISAPSGSHSTHHSSGGFGVPGSFGGSSHHSGGSSGGGFGGGSPGGSSFGGASHDSSHSSGGAPRHTSGGHHSSSHHGLH